MSEMKKLRVGLVGLGGVAQAHMKAYAASERVDLCAGADIDDQKTQAAAQRFGLKPYSNYVQMIEAEALDIVCVLTPPAMHRPVVEAAAHKGVNVLCEKPLAPSIADAEAIRLAVRTSGIRFLFGASYRHLPAMLLARQMIAEGAVGNVRLCMEIAVGGAGEENARLLSESHYPAGGPGGTPMGLVDHGIHLIDALPWLTGSSIISAFGFGNVAGERLRPEFASFQLDNAATGLLVYDEASVSLPVPAEGVFSAGPGWNLLGPVEAGEFDAQPCAINIFGSAGALRLYPYANILYHATTDGLRQIALPSLPKPNNFRAQIDSFADTIQTGAPLAASVDDGVNSLAALMAIYKSDGQATVSLG
ncbi:MAG: Gfo/Idh/MocA family oxidoreductase [Pseudomonadota bacterium]